MRAIEDQVAKNPEYLSVLDKKAIKNGKIDDKTQVEQVSVMNKLLNDALRAKGYAGPDIKMVLTDVTDPNGPYYTDTLTNTVVFDRTMLANANRDEILNALGHEFGHYSKEDNKTGTQTIANYSGKKLEDRTKGIVVKEATEDTLAAIRNNKNIITGEEGKKLADSIPMDRREYYEAITFEGRIMVIVIGADSGMGVIYYKDPKTGEEQFGRIENIAVKYGVSTAIEGGGTIKSYSKPNTPIQDFTGYYGGVRGTAGYGLNVNYEFSISNNEGKHGGGVGVGTGISFAGFFGKRKVIVLENLSEAEKEVIRTLVRYKGEIVDTYDFYYNLKKIKELMK